MIKSKADVHNDRLQSDYSTYCGINSAKTMKQKNLIRLLPRVVYRKPFHYRCIEFSACEMDGTVTSSDETSKLGFSTSNREHFINGFSGLIAGACGIFVGHPFDTMKIRLQVGDVKKKASVGAGSFAELYRGIIPPLVTAGGTQFIVFTIYEHVKKYLLSEDAAPEVKMSSLSATFTAATIAGAFSSYVTSPAQLVKVQQQSSPVELTLRQCVTNIVSKHGWKGLFHGSVSVLVVEGIGRGVYMLTYEFLKMKLSDSTGPDVSLQVKASSAAGAGAFSWLVMYPMDSIKSRRLSNLSSKSSYECFQQTMQGGGVRAFYRGCGLAMLRTIPVSGTILPLYEYCRENLSRFI